MDPTDPDARQDIAAALGRRATDEVLAEIVLTTIPRLHDDIQQIKTSLARIEHAIFGIERAGGLYQRVDELERAGRGRGDKLAAGAISLAVSLATIALTIGIH